MPRSARAGASRRLFAGRAHELEVLAGELARARARELCIVLLSGEAGIGKTRLAAEAVARAGQGVLVLTARAHAFGTSTAFGLWVEALERHLRTLGGPTVLRLAGAGADVLAPLLRSVEAAAPGRGSRRTSGYRLVDSVVGLVAAVSDEQPTILVLDDVHLADAASWEALHFLARDRPALPLLVIAAGRPEELAEHPTALDIVLALEQDGLLRRVRLGPLGPDDLAELARQGCGREVVPPAVVRWLESRSRGNPLYANGLLAALLDRGGDLEAPALTDVPEDLGERIAARLRGLDGDARTTLELLAILGARTELVDLSRIAGCPLDRVAVALEVLERRRLVAADDSGPAPAFEIAHPLVQDAIVESVGAARRLRLHAMVGRTLLASGQLAAGATHLARSASTGDAEAVDALILALREAEERSLHRQVTAILAELLRLLPEGDRRWLDALRVMDPAADWVLAHLAEDGVGDAYAAMRRIEPVADRAGDPKLRAVVQTRLACFGGVGMGRLPAAERACETAAELFDVAGLPGLALLGRAEAPFVLTLAGRHHDALKMTEALLPQAESLGDAAALIHLLMHLSLQLPYLGRFEEAWAAEQRAMRLAAEAHNDYRLALFRHRHQYNLAMAGRIGDALAMAREPWDSPAATDALAQEFRIPVAWLAGDLEAALGALAKARTRNRTAVSMRQSMMLSVGAHAAIEADRLDGVPELLRRAAEANRGFHSVMAAHPPWALAVLAWRLGESDAVDQLRAAAETICDLDSPVESAYFLVDLAEAAAEQGRGEDARWAAEQAQRAVRSVARFPFPVALADLVAAYCSADERRARAAIDTFRDVGAQLFLGRAQLALGRALTPGHPRQALATMAEAAATFGKCGAGWHLSRTRDAMRATGPQGRRAAAATLGPAALSARESEVARLAAAGRTAREIAAAMFIGERTVETHLRSAYAKLGVGSKRELVQRADELGLRT